MNTTVNAIKINNLKDLTHQESGVLLFHYNGEESAIIANWGQSDDGMIPMVFAGFLIDYRCNWKCTQVRHTDSVLAEVTGKIIYDANGDVEMMELEDPEADVYELVCGDGTRITAYAPKGWN